MNLKKYILIILIVIPVGLIVFVKFFGENQYELPIYFADSYPKLDRCTTVGPDYINEIEKVSISGKVNLLIWEPECDSEKSFFNGQLLRIKSNFRNEDRISYISISEQDAEYKNDAAICGLLIDLQKEANLENWRCDGFFVMLDGDKRIRGYYSGSDFEDIDRLILELYVMETIIQNAKR